MEVTAEIPEGRHCKNCPFLHSNMEDDENWCVYINGMPRVEQIEQVGEIWENVKHKDCPASPSRMKEISMKIVISGEPNYGDWLFDLEQRMREEFEEKNLTIHDFKITVVGV